MQRAQRSKIALYMACYEVVDLKSLEAPQYTAPAGLNSHGLTWTKSPDNAIRVSSFIITGAKI